MNQELLTGAIAFFKEQNGTYESMKEQMLAGGISLSEINQVYAEIQKLGLDPNGKYMKAMEKANPIAASKITIHPVSAEMPLTSKVSHTEMAHASYATVPQPTTLDTQAPIPASPTLVAPIPAPQIEPTPINTFHGMTTADTFTTQTSTPPLPTATSSHHFLAIFLTLFLLLGLGAGGVFAYATYNPESTVALTISSTLESFGLIPPKQQPVTIVSHATTTYADAAAIFPLITNAVDSAVSVSATVLATSSNEIPNNNHVATSSTQIKTSISDTERAADLKLITDIQKKCVSIYGEARLCYNGEILNLKKVIQDYKIISTSDTATKRAYLLQMQTFPTEGIDPPISGTLVNGKSIQVDINRYVDPPTCEDISTKVVVKITATLDNFTTCERTSETLTNISCKSYNALIVKCVNSIKTNGKFNQDKMPELQNLINKYQEALFKNLSLIDNPK